MTLQMPNTRPASPSTRPSPTTTTKTRCLYATAWTSCNKYRIKFNEHNCKMDSLSQWSLLKNQEMQCSSRIEEMLATITWPWTQTSKSTKISRGAWSSLVQGKAPSFHETDSMRCLRDTQYLVRAWVAINQFHLRSFLHLLKDKPQKGTPYGKLAASAMANSVNIMTTVHRRQLHQWHRTRLK